MILYFINSSEIEKGIYLKYFWNITPFSSHKSIKGQLFALNSLLINYTHLAAVLVLMVQLHSSAMMVNLLSSINSAATPSRRAAIDSLVGSG